MLLLPLIYIFISALSQGFSVPMTKDSSSSGTATVFQGSNSSSAETIGENGLAINMTTLEGEVQAFYKYNDHTFGSPTDNDGIVYTNGTVTLIPMIKCPSYPNYTESTIVYLIVLGIAADSKIKWDTYSAGLPSPCESNSTTTVATTPTVISPSDGSGNDNKQPCVIILTIITILRLIEIQYKN